MSPTRVTTTRPQLSPMLATSAASVPNEGRWSFEPKYDGIRVLALVDGRARVTLVTRNGNDKAPHFPEVAAAIGALGKRAGRALVLDGEIVARGNSRNGDPARFQALQGRMHVTDKAAIARHTGSDPADFVAFDLLEDGDASLIDEPWTVRRAALEKLLDVTAVPKAGSAVRLADSLRGGSAAGERLLAKARRRGWEGVIAKREDAPYEPGRRSDAWRKLKVEFRQEFVVGGWTEPRRSREHFGALLLGYHDGDRRLVYAGHTGSGFDRSTLREMARALASLERGQSPFASAPRTNEPAHWVSPKLVVEVKFTEWTDGGKLRHPIFVGVRDDKEPRDVVREGAPAVDADKTEAKRPADVAPARGAASRRTRRVGVPSGARVVARLEEIEASGEGGVLDLGSGGALELTSLAKPFFTRPRYTKGDLLRYYARVAPVLLPAIADRPLVLRRFPNGIAGPAFYQHKAPDRVPDGVRVADVADAEGETERRLVGGDLLTLLYTVQLGAVSVDPWHGRVGALDEADYSIIDLDPGPRASFRRVVDVARCVGEELDSLGLRAGLKTSGATGIHVVLPLPPGTPHAAARLVAELVATRVADRHPRLATVVRGVRERPAGTVYVDYLQNIPGKTVAAVYAARARPGATVSTPLEWRELTTDLDPRDFTIESVPERIDRVGDLWGRAMRKANSLDSLELAPRSVRRTA